MAAITLLAVLAEVPVIFAVTTAALRRHFQATGGLVMAIGALQLAVGAEQREMRLFRVIENPQPQPFGEWQLSHFLPRPPLCASSREWHSTHFNGVASNASVVWHCAQLTTRCSPSSGKWVMS